MEKPRPSEKAALTDLLGHPGWAYVLEHIQEEKERLTRLLINSNEAQATRDSQLQLRRINELQNWIQSRVATLEVEERKGT